MPNKLFGFSYLHHFVRCLSSFVAALILMTSTTAKAELRVFELLITNSKTNQSRVVLSNLDHLQYPGYHHLTPDETIAIQDSWMCRQRSDDSQDPNHRYCTNPHKAAAQTAPTTPPA